MSLIWRKERQCDELKTNVGVRIIKCKEEGDKDEEANNNSQTEIHPKRL